MIRQVIESLTNRDVIKEIAKTIDMIRAVKADGSDLIVNGEKNGKKINFTLSGKVSDWTNFEKFYKKYTAEVNKLVREYSN
jgi:predicted secreted protein